MRQVLITMCTHYNAWLSVGWLTSTIIRPWLTLPWLTLDSASSWPKTSAKHTQHKLFPYPVASTANTSVPPTIIPVTTLYWVLIAAKFLCSLMFWFRNVACCNRHHFCWLATYHVTAMLQADNHKNLCDMVWVLYAKCMQDSFLVVKGMGVRTITRPFDSELSVVQCTYV